MTILIPYKSDNGIALKYTLRGIDKHMAGNEVVLVGDSWGKVDCIPYKDKPGLHLKERNIFEKLLQGPSEFLMMNDDHFLLKDYEAEKFPYYYD